MFECISNLLTTKFAELAKVTTYAATATLLASLGAQSSTAFSLNNSSDFQAEPTASELASLLQPDIAQGAVDLGITAPPTAEPHPTALVTAFALNWAQILPEAQQPQSLRSRLFKQNLLGDRLDQFGQGFFSRSWLPNKSLFGIDLFSTQANLFLPSLNLDHAREQRQSIDNFSLYDQQQRQQKGAHREGKVAYRYHQDIGTFWLDEGAPVPAGAQPVLKSGNQKSEFGIPLNNSSFIYSY